MEHGCTEPESGRRSELMRGKRLRSRSFVDHFSFYNNVNWQHNYNGKHKHKYKQKKTSQNDDNNTNGNTDNNNNNKSNNSNSIHLKLRKMLTKNSVGKVCYSNNTTASKILSTRNGSKKVVKKKIFYSFIWKEKNLNNVNKAIWRIVYKNYREHNIFSRIFSIKVK